MHMVESVLLPRLVYSGLCSTVSELSCMSAPRCAWSFIKLQPPTVESIRHAFLVGWDMPAAHLS